MENGERKIIGSCINWFSSFALIRKLGFPFFRTRRTKRMSLSLQSSAFYLSSVASFWARNSITQTDNPRIWYNHLLKNFLLLFFVSPQISCLRFLSHRFIVSAESHLDSFCTFHYYHHHCNNNYLSSGRSISWFRKHSLTSSTPVLRSITPEKRIINNVMDAQLLFQSVQPTAPVSKSMAVDEPPPPPPLNRLLEKSGRGWARIWGGNTISVV